MVVDLVGGRRDNRAERVEHLGSVRWRQRAPFDARNLDALTSTRSAVPGAGSGTRLVAVSRSALSCDDITLALGGEDVEVELVGRYSNPDDLLPRLERLRRSPREQRSGTVRQPRQTQNRLADREIAEPISRRGRGDMIDDLAARFGIHRTAVMAHLDRHGVARRTGIVQRRIDEAQRLYESGWSLARIGAGFVVNTQTVRRALRSAGVSMRRRPGI